MLRLRTGIGVLALWFFIFFNIERFDAVNIASFVYLLVPISAGLLLLVPKWFANNRLLLLMIPVLIMYFGLKIYFNYPIYGGAALATTTTEVVSIVLSLMLVRQIMYIVLDFEDTIAKLTFRQIGVPPRLLHSIDTEELYREVKRSRRFQHPLSMLIVEPDFDPKSIQLNAILEDLKASIASRFIQARLAKLLSEELRDSDLIAQHGDGFAVLLPETSPEDAERIINLVRTEAQSRLGMDLKIGASSFPEGALTLGGLIDAATDNMATQGVPVETRTGVLAQGAGE
jgi:hypothetical protein